MLPSDVLSAGNSALSTRAIAGIGAVGVLAAGGTQATATQLPASQNILGVAAAGGVKLPPCQEGAEIWVRNDSGANVTVYPFEVAGVTIAPALASLVVATAKTIVFKAATSSVWMALLGA